MTSDVPDKTKTKAYVVPEGFLYMGTMKSHLAALEGLSNLHHQRSASPDSLAYSEKLSFLISQDVFTLWSFAREKQMRFKLQCH